MRPTWWKRRIIEWICEVFGHRKELTYTYAGKNTTIAKGVVE